MEMTTLICLVRRYLCWTRYRRLMTPPLTAEHITSHTQPMQNFEMEERARQRYEEHASFWSWSGDDYWHRTYVQEDYAANARAFLKFFVLLTCFVWPLFLLRLHAQEAWMAPSSPTLSSSCLCAGKWAMHQSLNRVILFKQQTALFFSFVRCFFYCAERIVRYKNKKVKNLSLNC